MNDKLDAHEVFKFAPGEKASDVELAILEEYARRTEKNMKTVALIVDQTWKEAVMYLAETKDEATAFIHSDTLLGIPIIVSEGIFIPVPHSNMILQGWWLLV
ncbi:MAG: hypothetical protein HXS54_05905 [Theionarchaea archaeon]|nr:hypothetical protein [Theionarchaea archaeon]DBA34902.1 TPA_asm: hypothetical protein vir521_00108 [Caudoviricetes sp. vir521]